MAGVVETEGSFQEQTSHQLEISDVDETYYDNECQFDQNELSVECVEIKDDEEEGIPRVINLVDDLNSSLGSNVMEIIDESPGKLRRSTRASARRYRQRNKTSTSSESEPEIIFVKKSQKRKHPGRRSTSDSLNNSRDENGNHKKVDALKDSKIEEKENKRLERKIKLFDDTSKREIKLSNGHNHRSSTPILYNNGTDREIKLNNHHSHRTYSPTPLKMTEAEHILEGIKQVENFFDDSMCRKIEKKIDQIAEKAKCGLYRQKTYDRAPLRNKYFFGEGYTYGKQMESKGPGQERVYAKGDVDEVPKWIEKHIIQKIYDDKIVEKGFLNSAVINEYFPGGCIVSHIDPIHIFDRPIISISFNCKTYLSFGCKFSFNPIRTTEPIVSLPLERGCLTSISGYAADNVTHCVRPQDITERRCVIILRRVFPDAPRVGDPISPEYPLSHVRRKHPRSYSYENSQVRVTRKRSRVRDYYGHDNRTGEQSHKRRKTRHSY